MSRSASALEFPHILYISFISYQLVLALHMPPSFAQPPLWLQQTRTPAPRTQTHTVTPRLQLGPTPTPPARCDTCVSLTLMVLQVMRVWCEGRKEDWFCTHIGWRPLRTASALASLLRLLVQPVYLPPLLHMCVSLTCRSTKFAPSAAAATAASTDATSRPNSSGPCCILRATTSGTPEGQGT